MFFAKPQPVRLLVACVGNLDWGDDGFGVEVAHQLMRKRPPAGVRVIDFGDRELDLAHALLEGYETVILVKAAPHGLEPGSLQMIQHSVPGDGDWGDDERIVEGSNLDPVRLVQLVSGLSGTVKDIFVIACEPESRPDDESEPTELSEPVRAAVSEAVIWIEALVSSLLDRNAASGVAPTPVSDRYFDR